MNSIQRYLKSYAIRWLCALAWTAMTLALMLAFSGDGTAVTWISKLFGGTETTDAIGHVMLYGGLTLLWIWALVAHYPKRTAILIAAGIGLVLGIGCELSQQFVIERGTTVLDLAANITGICFAGVLAHRTRAEPTP